MPLMALLLTVATSPFTAVLLIKREASAIVDDTMAGLQAAGAAQLAMTQSFTDTISALSATNREIQQRLLRDISERTAKVDARLKDYSRGVRGLEEQAMFNRVVESRKHYRETRSKVLAMAAEGRLSEARSIFDATMIHEYREYADALGKVVSANLAEADLRGSRIMKVCTTLQFVEGLLLVFFVLYAFFVPAALLLERLQARGRVSEI